MNKIFAVATAVLAFAAPSFAQADVISIRGDAWCPYNCEPTDPNPGYMIEIAKEVFEKAGHTVDYQTLTWARALEKVKAGEFSAAVGAAKDDAPELIYGKNPLGNSSNTFAIRAEDSFVYSGTTSLESKSIGVINGYSYVKEMDDYISKNKADPKRIQMASGDSAMTTNINKLSAKRIDMVLEDNNVLSYYISSQKLENKIRVVDSSLAASKVYIAFSPAKPKSSEYASMLDKGIDEMRASGRFAAILAKYGLKDWQ